MPSYDPDKLDQGPPPPTKMPSWIKFNAKGELKAPLRTFIRLMFSDDNAMPSSSRVVGSSLFASVTAGFGAITWVLLWKIVHSESPQVVEACVGGIRNLLWGYSILTFSALSMYGIHVWKYVAQLQSGFLGTQANPFNGGYGGYNNMNKSYTPSVTSSIADKVIKEVDPTPPPGPAKPPVKTPLAGVGSDED